MKRTFIVFLAISFTSFFLVGCGSQGSQNSAPGTGSIAFQAQWLGGAQTTQQEHALSASPVVRTAPANVTTVQLTISGSGMTTMGPISFAASAGQGTISGIPVGTNRTLLMVGLNSSNAVVYEGVSYNITVTANQTSNVGTITLAPVEVGGLSGPAQVAVDLTNIYWTEEGTGAANGYVKKMSIATGAITTLASGLSDPVGIAIDASFVYWTEYAQGTTGLGSVKRISISGGTPTTLTSGISSPWGITVDGTNVYWTDLLSSGAIMQINKSSVNAAGTTLTNGVAWPVGIVVDATNVYWTENPSNGGAVKKVPIGGGTVTTLATSLSSPEYLAVDATSVYYTEYGTEDTSNNVIAASGSLKKVLKSALSPTTPTTLASGLNYAAGIAVDSTNVYFTEYGFSVGTVKYVPITANNATPTPVTINLPDGTTTPATGLHGPYYLAIDPSDQYVYWTETDSGTIKRALTGVSSTTAPSAPTGVTTTAGNAQMTVSWTASAGATSYNIYYSTSAAVSPTNYTGLISTTATSAIVSGLINGTTYYCIVTAVNGAGQSAASNPAASAVPSSAISIPSAPTGVTAIAGNAQVTVNWTASVGATSYNVYYATTAAVSTASNSVTTTTTSAVVTGLTNTTTYYFIVTAVNSAGESAASSPSVSAVPTAGTSQLTLMGSFVYSGATGGDMAVNPTTQQVYISSGMGQQGMIRINASNPASMSQTTLSYGGGVAVDKTTGRYATTNGSSTLYILNSNDTLYDSQTIIGCGGDLDSDPATGRFFISTQCTDHIAVYSEGSKSILADIANNGVGSVVVFDPGAGNIFENLTPNNSQGGQTAPLVVSPSYTTSLPFTGFVRTSDGVLKHVYVSDNSGNLLVKDSTTLATLHTFTAFGNAFIAADTALGRFYAVTGTTSFNTLSVYDANTYAQIGTSVTLPGSIMNLRMAPGDNRLYMITTTTLYVYQR